MLGKEFVIKLVIKGVSEEIMPWVEGLVEEGMTVDAAEDKLLSEIKAYLKSCRGDNK